MRIIFLHPAIRSYRVELFERLSRHGVEFLFTSINSENTPAGVETANILNKTPIKFHQCNEIEIGGKKNFSFDLWRVFKYDTVIFSCATSIPFLLLSLPLNLFGRRVVLFDELWKYPENNKIYNFLRPIIRFLVRKTVKSFVAAGSCATKYITAEYGFDSDKVHIAYNTTICANLYTHNLYKSDKFVKLKVEMSLCKEPVILYLGRLVKYKGLDILIQAVAQLKRKVILLVVGDGPFRADCEALAKSFGVFDRVKFWGACESDEVTCFYEEADLFVLPTRFLSGDAVGSESWGFTINEAMGHSIPVIATDAVGAAHDLIMHGETGWMCQAESISALAAVICEALSDLNHARQVGANGKQRLYSLCSYQQNEEAFCQAIGLSN
jgi:glycosyltransferase involved in cell wall biosynthesis